jgi:hypothetical protein
LVPIKSLLDNRKVAGKSSVEQKMKKKSEIDRRLEKPPAPVFLGTEKL